MICPLAELYNLKRLFEHGEKFEKLDICCLEKKSVLFPFLAKVKVLDYSVNSEYIQPKDLGSVDIETKDLNFQMRLDEVDGWEALSIAFLNRMAASGRLEGLGLSIDIWRHGDYDEVAPLAAALIRAIRANPQWSYLKLSRISGYIDWTPHLRGICEAMENHPGLCTFVVDIRTTGFDYSGLERLLSRNRNIVVLDDSGLLMRLMHLIASIMDRRRW